MMVGLFLGLVSDFPLIDGEILELAVMQLAGAFILSGILIYLLAKTLTKTKVWNKLILRDNIEAKSGYTSNKKFTHLNKKEGEALTDLRPAGTVIINDQRYDAVTQGEYIEKGNKIKVIEIEGSKIVVKILDA